MEKEHNEHNEHREKEPKKIVHIMRGISGSGKSTLAKEIAGEEGIIYSTDDWHINADGDYKFSADKISVYHALNLADFKRGIEEGMPLLVVDNTNIKKWEYDQYANIAKQYGYEVVIHEMPMISTDEAVGRNVHKVPREAIERQKKNWEKL